MNEVIGTKTYLAGGMSDSIKRLKQQNAAPLVLLHKTHLSAFFKGRYRSWRFALRSAFAILVYGVQSLGSRR